MPSEQRTFSDCVASYGKVCKDIGKLTDAKKKMTESEVLNRSLDATLSLLEL